MALCLCSVDKGWRDVGETLRGEELCPLPGGGSDPTASTVMAQPCSSTCLNREGGGKQLPSGAAELITQELIS